MKTHRSEFKIFISYARPDIDWARKLYQRLRNARFKPWLDVESLPGGADWKAAIEQELKAAHVVLVLSSKQSVTRDGFLQHEIQEALKTCSNKAPGKLYLMPLRLEDCPIHQRLADFHCIDLFDKDGWKRLLTQLKELRAAFQASSGTASPSPFAAPSASPPSASPLSSIPPPAIIHAPPAPGSTSVRPLRARHKPQIPLVAFPDAIQSFFAGSDCADDWSSLNPHVGQYLRQVGCKLESIVQIVPARPSPVVLGFECLGIGPSGESFRQILDDCRTVKPDIVRACLAVASIQTILKLRTAATCANAIGARRLTFTLNLDPVTLDSTLFKRLLHWYGDVLERNVIFEVNESTTTNYLDRLRKLQADFDLRYAADDLNEWNNDVRAALIDRVELTKMDHTSFKAAMDIRGDNPKEAIKRLRAYKVRGMPLVVEGVQDPDYVLFLERNWDHKKYGELYGQGYALDPGLYWDADVLSLKRFGLPGGSTLRLQA